MRGSIRLGRILGIPVAVNPSWVLILLLVVTTLATEVFPARFADRPPWVHWLLAAGAALLFFAAMVLHELGHSVVARYFDIPVRGITLFLLGAVAQTTRETRRPAHEFLMAAAGPAVSILVAGVFMVLWFLTGRGASALAPVWEWLWLTNVVVGLFNMMPAYPMDGGRVLRAALWALLGNERRATHWSALVGQGFAFLLMGIGGLIVLRAPGGFATFHPFGGMQFILIGLFISYAARQSDIQSGLLDYLGGYRVADVMLRDVPAALATTTVREALAGPLAGYGAAREWLLASDGGRFVGLAPRSALQMLAEERRYTTRVADLLIPAERLRSVRPEEPLSEVLQRMEAEQTPVLAVVENGQVVGIVHRGQITALMRTRRSPGTGE